MTEIEAGESLEQALARQGAVATVTALRIVAQVAKTVVEQYHRVGSLHGGIAPQNIVIDEQGRPTLLGSVAAIELGGDATDPQVCPPELQSTRQLTVPSNLKEAASALQDQGVAMDPRRIDLYPLGTLLCQLVTGESATAYLSSPRIKIRLSPDLRAIVDGALGYDPAARWHELGPFISALEQEITETGAPLKDPSDTSPHLTGAGAPDTSPAAPRITTPADQQLPFFKLGHYQILARLGHGGMGDVYRAYEESLQRTVAIKVLPPELARHPDFVQRFRAEATAAARLVHPNIVQIFFIGEDAGHHFFAMQFVDGEPLSSLLARRGKLSIRESISALEQVLLGLTAAHELGLVHRDIKPANILLDRKSGRALLADFGLVKSLEGSDRFTGTGMVMGTVDYLSPEQARGRPVDARSDLYSVGVLAYQMLSGRLPFVADSATSLIFQHVYEAPPPLRETAPEVPEPLAAIVAKLLSKSPEERQQSAAQVFAELQASWSGRTLPAAPASSDDSSIPVAEMVPEPSASGIIQAPQFRDVPPVELPSGEPPQTVWWLKARNRLLGRMQAIAPELAERMQNTQLLVSGAVEEYERRRHQLEPIVREAETILQELEARARENRAAAEQAALAASQTTDQAAIDEADQRERECADLADDLEERASAQREELEEMKTKLAQINSRLVQFRSQRDLLNARLKVAHAQLGLASSPKKRRLRAWLIAVSLVVSLACVLTVILAFVPDLVETAGYKVIQSLPVKLTSQPESVSSLGYDPVTRTANSNPLSDSIVDSDIPAAVPLRQFVGHEARVMSVDFHPRSDLFASLGADSTIRIWDPQTGLQVKKIPYDKFSRAGNIAFSQDGRHLAASLSGSGPGSFSGMQVWNWATGETVQRIPTNEYAFSPRERMAAGFRDAPNGPGTELAFWNYETGALQSTLVPAGLERQEFFSMTYSPDGSLLAFHTKQGIVLLRMNEGKVERIMERGDSAPTFNADGTLLAFGRIIGATPPSKSLTEVLVWDVQSGSLIGTFTSRDQKVNAIAFSGDGKHLIVAGENIVRIWDVKNAVVFKVLRSLKTESLSFDRHGRYLVTGGMPVVGSQTGPAGPYLLLWDLSASE